MPRRFWLVPLAVALVALVSAGAFVAWPDPVADARRELRAAVDDPRNHEPYAELVRAELAASGRLKTATFSMPCFWAGESHFGGLAGVYRTTPGKQGGVEAVRVDYDPQATSPDELLSAPVDPAAVGRGCRYQPEATAAAKLDPTFRPDDLDKWSIRQTDGLKCVPMTPAQAARVNAAFHAGRPVEPWLSPAQNARLAKVRETPRDNWHEYVGDDRLWKTLRETRNLKPEIRIKSD